MPYPAKHKIKKGKELPDNAIELAQFSNNVNKSLSSKTILSASSEKNTSQSKIGKKWLTVNDTRSISNGFFPGAQHYNDEYGFSGEIQLLNVQWEAKTRKYRKEIVIQKTYTVTDLNSVPRTIAYSGEDGSVGTLSLDSEYSGITKNISKNSVVDYCKTKYITRNYISNTDVSKGISGEYNGQLYLSGTFNTVKPNKSSNKITDSVVESNNGVFSPSITKDNKPYYFTNKYKQRTVQVWGKHYGLCRYWGGGGNSSNNYYGDPDYRFSVDGRTAKGYMNGAPAPTQQRWGHWMDRMSDHHRNNYPIDTGGYWDYEDGEYDGIDWTYDIEEAAKYGGSTDPAKGGVVWASQYWNASGGVWPPSGYQNDAESGSHVSRDEIVAGSGGAINHTAIQMCVKDGAQKTSSRGFYNAGGWYCKWFRDVILFYKGLTTGITYDGIYSNSTLIDNGYSTQSISNYSGYICKNIFRDTEKVDSYTLSVNYSGIVTRTVITYDGIAEYQGLVYKKIFINDIKRDLVSHQTFIQDYDGYLKLSPGNKATILSKNILVTNISYLGKALYYTAKLTNKIKIPNLALNDIIGPEYVKLIYDKDMIQNINYVVRVSHGYGNDYCAEIISDIPLGVVNKCSVVFIDTNNNFTEEDLYSELLLKNNIDYTTSNGSILITDMTDIDKDYRMPIEVQYRVCTSDGKYKSNLISTSVINKKYALFEELSKYKNQKCIVSPVIDNYYMTSTEIVAADNGIPTKTLEGQSFVIESITSSGDATIYTDPSGHDFVYCSTKADTGYPVFVNSDIFNIGKYNEYLIQKKINGKIYLGYCIKYVDQIDIGLVNPVDNHELSNWYLKIGYSSFKIDTIRNDINICAIYDIPEYLTQDYSRSLGIPYIDCVEKPMLMDSNTLKVKNSNMYVSTDSNKAILNKCLTVFNKTLNEPLTITGFDINGYIIVRETILPEYELQCSYSYAEENYIYKGYKVSNDLFAHLDINPNMYHTYIDPVELLETKSYNLFNKTIYFFLRPYKVTNNLTKEIIESNPSYTLYHKIDDSTPNNQFDILIGILAPTPMSSMKITDIVDHRRLGGGLKDEHIKNNEGVFDTSNSDGTPIPSNNTVVVKLTKSLLPDKITEAEIRDILKKHMPVGTVCILEYV